MSLIRKSGGGNASAVVRRRSGGGWVVASTVKRRQGGVWVNVWSSLGGSASGTGSNYNNGNSNAPATRVLAGTVTASPTGGTGSFSYSWSIGSVSNVTGATITSGPNSQSCGVSGTVRINVVGSIQMICTISDGASTIQVSTTISLNYFSTV